MPLIDVGQIGVGGNATDTANQNVFETYTITMIKKAGGQVTITPIADATTGSTTFPKPIDNVGLKTLPDYAAYAQNFIRTIDIPGCGGGKVFVGQRKDPFVVNLGQTFDLVNYAHPIGESYNNTGHDDLAANKNAGRRSNSKSRRPADWMAPTRTIGGWTTSSEGVPQPDGSYQYNQVSRLGNPLVDGSRSSAQGRTSQCRCRPTTPSSAST